MTSLKIVHLVDDTTAGGVMRMVEYLTTLPDLAANARQTIQPVARKVGALGRIDADVIVSHLSVSWRGLPGLIALRALNPHARLLHVEHSYTKAFTAANVAHKARFLALLRVAYSLFDQVIAVSQEQATWMRARRLVNPTSLSVIHPLVDLSPFEHLPAPCGSPRVVGAIGRLDRQKGFDILIDAFRLCPDPDARLKIFGEGAERASLEARAAGDVRIEFCGHAATPADAFRQVDIVAMPSRWEAFGLVALEAKTAGRRVLLSPVDGLKDQIDDTAEAVTRTDCKAWALALSKAMSPDGCARDIARFDASTVKENFTSSWRKALCEDEPLCQGVSYPIGVPYHAG